ncbi:MAG: hypothetical protein HYV32_06700 [Candidatus Kerfeldbacteria bacterium]|nr:hypothetical protein [Candidatus Kerfeldbacteria bacterium]
MFFLKRAVSAAIAEQEGQTGARVHTLAAIDFDGNLYDSEHRFDPNLPWMMWLARQSGVLLVAASDNPVSGIETWMRYLGIQSLMMPVRVADFGTRIQIRTSGRIVDHYLMGQRERSDVLLRFARLKDRVAESVRLHGIRSINGHPSRKERGLVFDGSRGFGFLANMLPAEPALVREVGGFFANEADALGLARRKTPWVVPEQGHFYLPPAGYDKVDGLARLVGVLPSHLRIVHCGDSAIGEKGTNHLSRVQSFAPRGTGHAKAHGVIELSRTAREGAVVELLARHVLGSHALAC